jgi:thioredoxin 2
LPTLPHDQPRQSVGPQQRTRLRQLPQAPVVAHTVALDEAAFDKHITRNQIPVLVDFWAPWCGPCRQMAPALEQATAQLEPQVRVAKVNTEEVQALGARFNIRSIPTLALFVGGREVARQAGAMGAADIVRWTQSHLPPT